MGKYQGRKIEAMHRLFGTVEGRQCKDCPHLARKEWGKTYYKCLAYGDSNSEATDWAKSWTACGHIKRPIVEGAIPIIKLLNPTRAVVVLDGQIEMEEII